MKKALLRITLVVIIFLVTWNLKHIIYGIGQAKGQLKIVWNAQPVDSVLNDPLFPDSLKSRLKLIKEIRRFAIDSLGVNDTENYTTLYDQKGKAVLWAVNASPKFEIRPYEWCFPIAGCFPYKGYFDFDKTAKEEKKLKKMGYDTYLRSVDGWSTLGFFNDPILSNMLNETEGDLAELIIHELTHATLYIKDSADYNENLATFVGNYGALEFLKNRFGRSSDEYCSFRGKLDDSERFQQYILERTMQLKLFYDSLSPNLPEWKKLEMKFDAIKMIFCEMDFSAFNNPKRFSWTSLDRYFPDNAFFSQYLTYHKEANAFETEFNECFNKDFKAYLEYLKATYGS